MTRLRIISALGHAIVAMPVVGSDGLVTDQWIVACIGRDGRWLFVIPCISEQAAKKERAMMFRLHRASAKKAKP